MPDHDHQCRECDAPLDEPAYLCEGCYGDLHRALDFAAEEA